MNEWIIILALTVAALSSAAVGMVVYSCRRRESEKDRGLMYAIHEQERLARELEHARIEKQTLERVLTAKLPAPDTAAEEACETVRDQQNEHTL